MTLPISNRQARRLFLERQGLCHPPQRKLTKADLLGLIEKLGYVQVDSINTVERAHHLILFSRNQTYRRKDLAQLLEEDRSLFENWTHDASIVPAQFYPYWRHRFGREQLRLREQWRKWHRVGFEDMLEGVLELIRQDGPLLSRDLEKDTKKQAGGWWDWHPSKAALEYLWRTGALAVDRREGFQKVYDLSERVIAPVHYQSEISPKDFVDWACRSALDRLGLATSGEIAAFWGAISPAEAKAWCLAEAGKTLRDVTVLSANGAKPRTAYAPEDIEEKLAALPAPPKRVRVLSPFDPLLRDRNRAHRLFNFHYRIEVFVPEAKREYGYYVFPLLEGDRLIGRIDMKANRKDGDLRVKGLWLEPGEKFGRTRQQNLEAELERVRRFVTAERISYAKNYQKSAR